MEYNELTEKLKEQIISYCNLVGVEPSSINNDTPLFGDGLALDSIDSIELVVLIEREYGIKINSATEGRKILVDVDHIARFIIENQGKTA